MWSPRFWHGMRTHVWWKLVSGNRFRIAPLRIPLAVGVTLFTPFNDLMAGLQWCVYGRRIRDAKVAQAPVFILGHWRSGTTLLHELLVTDTQFASPSTYQCFAPSHFLLSEWLMVTFGGFLLPKKRPMDNMEAGWQLPQEDEFALMNLGVPSPYLRIAFPNTQPQELEYLSLRNVPAEELSRWRKALQWFMRALTVRYPGKRLVMKSPPHTGRIAELAKLYPDAKFIHLTRNPRKLFLSTMRLWQSLDEVQSFQKLPSDAERKEYVSVCLQRMYESFDAGRKEVAPNRIVDVSYEELVADPHGTVKMLYEKLDLGDFSTVEPSLNARLENHASYRPNKHSIDPQLEQEILSVWGDYAAKYGY